MQANILSLLPDQRLIMTRGPAGAAGGDAGGPYRAIQILGALLDWFRSVFSAMAPDSLDGGDGDCFRPPLCFKEQAKAALRLRAGTAELLVTLFVALVRSMGLPARYVQLMDVIPLEPWRRRRLSGGKPLTARPEGAREVAKERRNIAFERQKAVVKSVGNKADNRPAEATGPEGRETQRRKKGVAGMGLGIVGSEQPDGSSENATLLKPSPPKDGSPKARRNRGEEEFEREMQLAMMATEAEAEARNSRAAKSSRSKNSGAGVTEHECVTACMLNCRAGSYHPSQSTTTTFVHQIPAP